MHMFKHFDNMKALYGDVYIQMPNEIFSDLKTIDKNIQQISFCFSYLVTVALLYKYAHFADVDNGTYIQNSDIKQILGYNKTTKTIDRYIKKNGVLENLELVTTTKDYPVGVEYTEEKINGINMREFKTISMLSTDSVDYSMIKSIVKNRNYEIREPRFLFEYKDELGTLYNYDNTFRVSLDEFMRFVYDGGLDNTDFFLYCYFKSKCYGKGKVRQLALNSIINDLGIGKDSFYKHLEELKGKGFVEVNHKGWRIAGESDGEIEANDYYFKGVR